MMNGVPDRLREKVIDIGGEELDELLWHYPSPDTTAREAMPEVRMRYGGDYFRGIILGYGTSFEEAHNNHSPGTRPRQGERCSGCRWTDVTIMWAQPYDDEVGPTAPPQYLVLIRGRSILPGETQRVRTTWTTDPDMVLDTLHVPIPKHLRVTGRERSVVGPHEDALLDAASLDEGLGRVADEYMTDKAGAR
jgi:hypothetical protein